jgi:hypothetical protein
MTMRRTFVLGVLGIAALSVGSMAIIHALTSAPPAGAPPPAREESVVRSPQAAMPPAAPPTVESAERAARARAPQPAPVPPAPAPRPAHDSTGTRTATPAVPAAGAMKVAFQLDSRLTKGLHMGARWVSPSTYIGTHDGSLFTVQARARGAGAAGAIRDPTWLPAEPDMVAVTPDRGSQVEIAVLREGRSTLTVAEGDVSKTLTVNAVHRDGVWRVDISQ